ncbi:hypothetical protein R3I94_001975 [Phoxinus phoxinus]
MRSSTCRKRVSCTESSTFPAFPVAHGTGLNDGVWGLAAETILVSSLLYYSCEAYKDSNNHQPPLPFYGCLYRSVC